MIRTVCLRPCSLDLSQSAAMSASQVAAERVLHSLIQAGEIRKHQVQQAGFMVLKSPDIPSMLVETAYISNPDEERRLRTPSHQAVLAAAIHHGIRELLLCQSSVGNPRRATGDGWFTACVGHRGRPTTATSGQVVRKCVTHEVPAFAHPASCRHSHQSDRRRRGHRKTGLGGKRVGRKRAGCAGTARRSRTRKGRLWFDPGSR